MSNFSRRDFLKTSALAAAGVSLSGFPIKQAFAAGEQGTVQGKAGITGIQHTAIYVQDMSKAVKYYEDVFGFKLITIANASEGPDKPIILGFMRIGDAFVELLQPVDTSKVNINAMNTLNHFCLRTTNAEETYNYFKSKGVNFETPIIDTTVPFDRKVTDGKVFVKYGDKGATVKIFFIRGPNGERIEVMQDNIGNIK